MNKNLILLIIELLIYVVIFILPIFIYLIKIEKVNPFKYLKLKENYLQGILIGICISVVFVILQLVTKKYTGGININTHIGIFWITGGLVGFLEEVPIRGFLLQKIDDKIPFYLANIIVTIIFVALHIPKWILANTISIDFIIKTAMVSLCFGYLLKEFKSLWVPIICHSIFDLSILIIL